MRKSLPLLLSSLLLTATPALAKNPLFEHVFTADPAAMVHDGTVYLYTGHDEAPNNDRFFEMHDWLLFTSKDMKTWQEHGPIMRATDFGWAKGDAWAAHMIERDGKFYFYTTVRHKDDKPGFAVGVAVADSPYGPFKDAIGKALITDDMTTHTPNDWDDIDPAVFIEENGDAYMFFGNLVPKYVKLKDNMVELDGEIKTMNLPNFTEALWVHKKDDNYYVSYACEFPEKICYAMSKSIHGPWEYKGILNEIAGNTETNHQSIIEFNGKSYFIYHTGAVPSRDGKPSGGRFRRSVAIDRLYYNEDGSLKRVVMTSEGIQ
ncbi:glycoside hydrolase family 43 protein [Bowmanella dokdonensis]|uniref:Glycoside hydrolase family 43 protein n=1 Tax=Bowmanella dokdonensis TaxID=751969 RepID=A0A939IT45_9ALTE|nr:glycoside hydrolase family 43 protein [Bowmanella dokdonensis]MBN7827402.1 glycoside hydrolase family 43 protein [Bowmanella dokdonensis]